jgi:hypothetical protein
METAQKPLQPINGLRKCGIYTVEYYSAIKKNEIMLFGKWMELEIMLI